MDCWFFKINKISQLDIILVGMPCNLLPFDNCSNLIPQFRISVKEMDENLVPGWIIKVIAFSL